MTIIAIGDKIVIGDTTEMTATTMTEAEETSIARETVTTTTIEGDIDPAQEEMMTEGGEDLALLMTTTGEETRGMATNMIEIEIMIEETAVEEMSETGKDPDQDLTTETIEETNTKTRARMTEEMIAAMIGVTIEETATRRKTAIRRLLLRSLLLSEA